MLGDIEEIIPSAGRLKFLPGGLARRGYIPDPNINAKCLEDCVVVNHNTIKHEFILHCELLHYLKRDDTRHYATLWEVTLHFKMLRSDINFSFSQTSTHVSRTVWKHGKSFVFIKHILVNKFCKCTFVFFFKPLS